MTLEMKVEEKKTILTDINSRKKQLLMMRIKMSSGNLVPIKEIKETKKEIARLFTKLNNKDLGV